MICSNGGQIKPRVVPAGLPLVCYRPLARISSRESRGSRAPAVWVKDPSVLDSDVESTQIDTPGYAFDARGSSIDDDDDNPLFKNT